MLAGSESLRSHAYSWTDLFGCYVIVSCCFNLFQFFHQVKSGKELVGILFNDFLLLAQPQRPIGNIASIFSMDMKANVHLKKYRNVSLHFICFCICSHYCMYVPPSIHQHSTFLLWEMLVIKLSSRFLPLVDVILHMKSDHLLWI